ncbi:hypothetical protein CISG_09113 [Coccidioides immitis RMSCC 3703]|uniref:Uncharacterized protein n=1 Tax=Coccidioides immitis RMSCC 3703 TaxID=454286 RepID=A0A0J8R9I9_COCIT|nr:hypothetical protein CISG_09113 [Coccidioides immitis RMSCC 3703]
MSTVTHRHDSIPIVDLALETRQALEHDKDQKLSIARRLSDCIADDTIDYVRVLRTKMLFGQAERGSRC